jgi:outer membrane protein, multidrug efflux system
MRRMQTQGPWYNGNGVEFVNPSKAGSRFCPLLTSWIPAFGGMTRWMADRRWSGTVSRVCVLGSLLIVLAGCAVGPDYKRPKVLAPEHYRFELNGAMEVANTAWWEQFDDPILSNLVRTALQENKDVLIASARIEEFVGLYVTARGNLFPNTSGSFIPSRQRLAGSRVTFDTFQASLSGSWEIDFWGRLRRLKEAARAELLASEEARRTVILTLVSSVVGTYVDLLALDESLAIAVRTAESRKESLDLFQLRLDYGIVSAEVVSMIEAEYRLAQSRIPQIERDIAQTENLLSILIGRNPGDILRGRSLAKLQRPEVPEGLPSELLEKRPDIRTAEQILVAENARIGATKALYYPTISLTGVLGAASPELSNLFGPGTGLWSLAGPIVMPLLNFGRIKGQVQSAEARQQQALYLYQQVIQNAFREVDDALIDHVKSQEQLQAQAQQVNALKNYLRLARMRYDEGFSSYIEVLDAERSLFNAELDYTSVYNNVFRSLINIYKALGGGWVAVAESGAPKAPICEPEKIVPLP